MEVEFKEPRETQSDTRPLTPPGANSVVPQQTCRTCGMPAGNGANESQPSWIYAIGHVEPRFPSISVEKEFAQAAARQTTAGLSDRQALHSVLSKPENRYLARQLCWVMTVEGLETYILWPREPADLNMLLDAVRAHPTPIDLDLVIVLGDLSLNRKCAMP